MTMCLEGQKLNLEQYLGIIFSSNTRKAAYPPALPGERIPSCRMSHSHVPLLRYNGPVQQGASKRNLFLF